MFLSLVLGGTREAGVQRAVVAWRSRLVSATDSTPDSRRPPRVSRASAVVWYARVLLSAATRDNAVISRKSALVVYKQYGDGNCQRAGLQSGRNGERQHDFSSSY